MAVEYRLRPAFLIGASVTGALLFIAVACGGGGQQATTPTKPLLTERSPHRGGPGVGFEYCDGTICATNGVVFAEWNGVPLKVLWRVEEAHSAEELAITARSADGRQTFVQDGLLPAWSPDDLPEYHYFPSSLRFPSEGVWVLELETGTTIGTIVVQVGQ